MSLDFTVLGPNGSPEKTVSIGVDLHHEFITTAANIGLTTLQAFKEYYEDSEIEITGLLRLAEEVAQLRAQTSSIELQRFLDSLRGLITYAMSKGQTLHAIAD